MTSYPITVVHCDASAERYSSYTETEIEQAYLDERLIEEIEQELDAAAERDLHNAAHHETRGPVTYLQEVHQGGFSVFAGKPGELEERFFGEGTMVAFMDDEGPGHGSKVGPDGVRRTLRVLEGHLKLPS